MFCIITLVSALAWDFPGGTVAKNLHALQETQIRSLGQEDALEKDTATYSTYSCLDNSMDRGAWWAMGPQSWARLSTHPEMLLHFHLMLVPI